MIVSAVADPTAFGPAGITDELSKREAIAFLKGIISNGVILDEPTQELMRNAILEVAKLPTKLGQRVQLLLTEIKKQHKKFVVACDKPSWQQHNATTIPEKCAAVAKILQADVVVTQASHLADMKARVGPTPEVCLLMDTSQSDFETKRDGLMHLDKPLDQLTPAEVDEFVGRALKYAPTLRIFDYRIIGSRKRISKYLEGIRFFVTIWEKWCIAGDISGRCVEIFTVGNTQTQNGFLDGASADALLESGVQKPLSATISSAVRRFI